MSGDTQEIKAFNALFARYYDRFVRFAVSYVRQEEAAEDIVMEAILYYWERRESLASDSNIPAYIMEVVKHKCLNELRHRRVRQEVETRVLVARQQADALRISTLEACNPQELFNSETQRLVHEAIRELPVRTRRIFLMNRYGGKTYAEIAGSLSLSVKAVEFHVSKALRFLRMRLKECLMLLLSLLTGMN